MKLIKIILISILYPPLILLGQMHQKKSVKIIPLQIGETLPKLTDYTIIDSDGNIKRSTSGTASFEGSKKRLIVMDFWTTYCSACIDNFPYVSEIQEKFEDDIKIFLVNSAESADKISNWIKNRNSKSPGNHIIPKNLEILVSEELGRYFPLRHEIGYHVWLGKDMRFILRGIHENTNPEKIKRYLSGEKFSFLSDKYGKSLDKPILLSMRTDTGSISSAMQPFIVNENAYGKAVYRKVDTSNNTIRTTLINTSLLHIFRYAYEFRLTSKKILNRPRDFAFGNIIPSELTSNRKILGYYASDLDIERSSLSYEIISPMGIPDSIIREKVGADVKFYCEQNRKIRGNVVALPTKVYKLIVSDSEKFEKVKFNKHSSFALDSTDIRKKKFRVWHGYSLDELFNQYFNGMIHKFDETVKSEVRYDGKVKIALPEFPEGNYSVSELRKYLQPQGLDIVESIEPVNTLVFSRK